jgi:hypothetical protein
MRDFIEMTGRLSIFDQYELRGERIPHDLLYDAFARLIGLFLDDVGESRVSDKVAAERATRRNFRKCGKQIRLLCRFLRNPSLTLLDPARCTFRGFGGSH